MTQMHPLHESAKAVADRKGIALFRKRVLSWFNKNKRRYPWRETRDPFRVLIAEMMLRRTKADQVQPVYERLLSEYPDVGALADADDRELEQILYPLGLKWRMPAFARIAREIREKHNGQVPAEREKLTGLPGVGDYVAGAVLSIAYNKREWIVDSNIVRLFRRYFGIKTSREGRRDRHVIEMARIYACGRNPREANLAILDFSALVCTPVKPRCERCPLKNGCHYQYRQGL
jgi:A/G-specific adenine glycosylase